jgi:glycosyltransferase involved in cell wall biosynthesis
MNQPLVSALIDTYNHERFIEQALVSVLEQDLSLSDVEIIVVDDGSTDRTPEIVSKFGPRVRLIRKENGGQVSAFNFASPELRGQIVAFLDGDDWWAKKKLTTVAESFEANRGIAAVGHGYYEVFDEDPPRQMLLPEKTCLLDLSSTDAARFAAQGLVLLGTSRLSVRRHLLDRVGALPKEVIFFDYPVFTLALALGGALVLDQPLCYYRRHALNLYAPASEDLAARRRKQERLGFLVSYLPPRLVELGVPRDIVEAFLESERIEYDRVRLQFGDEHGRWNVLRTELRRFRASYKRPSIGYRLFECAVGLCALALPPQRFYGLLDWYSRNNISRFRDILGKPDPKVPPTFFQRRPLPSGCSRSGPIPAK